MKKYRHFCSDINEIERIENEGGKEGKETLFNRLTRRKNEKSLKNYTVCYKRRKKNPVGVATKEMVIDKWMAVSRRKIRKISSKNANKLNKIQSESM